MDPDTAALESYDFLLLAKPTLAGAPAIVHVIEPVQIQCSSRSRFDSGGSTSLPSSRTALNYQLEPPTIGTYVVRTCTSASGYRTSLIVRVRNTSFADLEAATMSFTVESDQAVDRDCPTDSPFGKQVTIALYRHLGVVIDVMVVPEDPAMAPNARLTASLQCPEVPEVCATSATGADTESLWLTGPAIVDASHGIVATAGVAIFQLNATVTGIHTISAECNYFPSELSLAGSLTGDGSPTSSPTTGSPTDALSRNDGRPLTLFAEAGVTISIRTVTDPRNSEVVTLRVQQPASIVGCQNGHSSFGAATIRYVAPATGLYTATACVAADVDMVLRAGFQAHTSTSACLRARAQSSPLSAPNFGDSASYVDTLASCQSLCTANLLCEGIYWNKTTSACSLFGPGTAEPYPYPGDCFIRLEPNVYDDDVDDDFDDYDIQVDTGLDIAVRSALRSPCISLGRLAMQVTVNLALGQPVDILVTPGTCPWGRCANLAGSHINVTIECPGCAASAGPGLVADHSVWEDTPARFGERDWVRGDGATTRTARCRHSHLVSDAVPAPLGVFTCTAGKWIGRLTCHNNASADGLQAGACNETLSGNGAAYRGCQSRARSGARCQRWDLMSRLPHAAVGVGAHNFCRNPSPEDSPTIWCYTVATSRRESCMPLHETAEPQTTLRTFLQDGIYYRALPMWVQNVGNRSAFGIAGAMQLASSARFGPLSGHLAAPTTPRENAAVAQVLRSYVARTTGLFAMEGAYTTWLYAMEGAYIAVRNAKERVSDRHLLQLPDQEFRVRQDFPPYSYLHADTPLWTMVAGRDRGMVVWNGTCPSCICPAKYRTSGGSLHGTAVAVQGDGSCVDIRAAGNQVGAAFTNWSSHSPEAVHGCVRLDINGAWSTVPCSNITDGTLRTIVQFEHIAELDPMPSAVCDVCDCLKPFRGYHQLGSYARLSEGIASLGFFNACLNSSVDASIPSELCATLLRGGSLEDFLSSNSSYNAKVDCSNSGLIEMPSLHDLQRIYAAYNNEPITLDLSGNRLTQVPRYDPGPQNYDLRDEFLGLGSLGRTLAVPGVVLWKLDLGNNRLTTLPCLWQQTLAVLDLSSNPITVLTPGSFRNLPLLERLVLNGLTSLTEVRTGVFFQLANPRLTHVTMHAATVTLMPTLFTRGGETNGEPNFAELFVRPRASFQLRGPAMTCGLSLVQAAVPARVGAETVDILVVICNCAGIAAPYSAVQDNLYTTRFFNCTPDSPTDPTAAPTDAVGDRSADSAMASDSSSADGTVVGGVVGGLSFLALFTGVVLFVRTRRKTMRTQKHSAMMAEMVDQANSAARREFLSTCRHILELEGRSNVSDSVAAFDKSFAKLRVRPKDVSIDANSVGEGTFGRIYPAAIGGSRALAKCANTNVRSKLSECLVEAMRIHLLRHEHIVSLVGIVDNHIPMMYAVEYMTGGSLKQFLRRNRPGGDAPSSISLSTADLVVIASKIAAGCEFLERKHVTHRNLAADAVMVSSDGKEVKLANLGEARDIYETATYVASNRFTSLKRLAVRWMAPESIRDSIFSTKSDVWAFGVTCFEVFSFGKTPYGALSASEIADEVLGGRRLEPPAMCSDRLRSLVTSTWAADPLQRPTFATVSESLKLQTMPDALKVFALQARSRTPPSDELAIVPARQLEIKRQLADPTGFVNRHILSWTTRQQQPSSCVVALSVGSSDGSLLAADLQAMLRVRACTQVLAPIGRSQLKGLGAVITLGSSTPLTDKVLSDVELPTLAARRGAASDVASAVEFITGHGIIVQSLHPGLCHVTVESRIKLLVVGTAASKQTCPEALEVQRWNAPETRTDGTVTAASNLYSLGTLVWAMHRTPHPWIAVADPNDTGPFPEQLDSQGIPERLATVLQTCRQVDPAARPTASAVLDALRDGWEIDPARLTSLRALGAGEFGEVTLMLLSGPQPGQTEGISDFVDRAFVAVKSLRQDGDAADESAGQKFLAELALMKGLRHPQIVQLLGAVTESQPQMIVLEFLAGGSLDGWLEENWAHGLQATQLDQSLHQIALGMGAINAAGIVHRDLASRNVLVGEGLSCKVADLGLSRTMASQKEYYKFKQGGLISLRWTAPECLTQLKWTSASDVYSFGVLISEVYAAGAFPFDALTDNAVVEFITAGNDPVESKLLFSWEGGPSSPSAVSTAAACLMRDPTSRPTFDWLANAFLPSTIVRFEEELSVSAGYIEVEMSSPALTPAAALGRTPPSAATIGASLPGHLHVDGDEALHGSTASTSDAHADRAPVGSPGSDSSDRSASASGTADGTGRADAAVGYLEVEGDGAGVDETSL